MNEKLTVGGLAVVTLLSLWCAPWVALSRATRARSTVLLLPNRVIDFSGRTEPLALPSAVTTLWVVLIALLAILGACWLARQWRFAVWAVAGLVLLVAAGVSLGELQQVTNEARVTAFVAEITEDLADPNDRMDVPGLEAVLDAANDVPLETSLAAARDAGVNVRRLPYNNAGLGWGSFLVILTGIITLLASGRYFAVVDTFFDRALERIAVPAISILLALVAAAFVVLILQPTPAGDDISLSFFGYLVGRFDTLWYAYEILFAVSLGSLAGFLEALKFATPLIFTGLAVAFSFRSGLFNIGAPGQMVLGAVFAMLVGVYVPGSKLFVLPLAVLAAALGGGMWGALPGWLKARFGANEVINTILLNYIAASLLLFLLSSEHQFAAPAWRITLAVLIFSILALVSYLLSLAVPLLKNTLWQKPRLTMAGFGIALVIVSIIVGIPRASDSTVSFRLPFKVPGSEPKTQLLDEGSRLPQLPALLGIDLEQNPGVNVIPIDVALPIMMVVAVLLLVFLPRFGEQFRPWRRRVLAMIAVVYPGYFVLAFAGLADVQTAIPPTQLNVSFVIAIAAAVLVYLLLWKTKWGFELRAVGLSPKAAEYGGADIARNTVLAMSISGALAGLTACHYVLGGALEEYSLRVSLPTGDGFDGIAVALLGGNTPLGVVLSAFLFGVLKSGGSVLSITYDQLSRDVVNMLLALVVLFIAAKGFLPEWFTNPIKRAARAERRAAAKADPSQDPSEDPEHPSPDHLDNLPTEPNQTGVNHG
jgi:simple sugar transport system permease protein